MGYFILILLAAGVQLGGFAQVPEAPQWMADKIDEEFAHFRARKTVSKK